MILWRWQFFKNTPTWLLVLKIGLSSFGFYLSVLVYYTSLVKYINFNKFNIHFTKIKSQMHL